MCITINLVVEPDIGIATRFSSTTIGNTPGFDGDFTKALGSIKAEVLYMPSETDMYFHIDALREEAKLIPGVKFRVIPSLWGHIAGAGFSPEDALFINDQIEEFYR